MNTSRGVNRYIHLFPQMPYSLDVIRMIVRYKYGTYTFHQNIEIFQCFLDGTDADTGIYQYSIGISTQIIAVPTAATRQAYKSYFHVLSFFIKMQNAVNFYSKVTANIRKKEDIYREDFFFLSMDSVIFANNSNAMAAINPIAAK